MNPGPRLDRRGFALPVTLIALTAAALLASAGLMLARLEARSGDLTLASFQAGAAAEGGIEVGLNSWSTERWDTLVPGQAASVGAASFGSHEYHTDSIVHLGGPVFLARSIGEARDADGRILARTALGRWVRADPPRFPADAGLIARGPIEVGGGITVDGNDRIPAGWSAECPPSATSSPAVRDSTASPIYLPACSGGSCLFGTPPMIVDSAISDSSLSHFGPWNYPALRASATRRFSGLVSGWAPSVDPMTGRCDATNGTNLGEPLDSASDCFQFFPIAVAAPGTRLENSRGQGILLADGDLELGDGVDFYGVVIVTGRLSMPGLGSRVTGVVILRHAASDTAQLLGSSSVLRSTCAVRRAADRAAPWRPVGGRSWVRF